MIKNGMPWADLEGGRGPPFFFMDFKFFLLYPSVF